MKNPDLNDINQIIGVVADSTKNTRNSLDNIVSRGIDKFAEFLKSTPLGIRIDTYIAERPYKLEQALENMKNKYGKIPDEAKTEPSSYIALTVANNLNYCLDEEHLKNMFINLLISDMDKRKQNKVLPAYTDIITQLSLDDANFLKDISGNGLLDSIPIIQLQVQNVSNIRGYGNIGNYFICSEKMFKYEISPIVLDNLRRLRLVDIPYNTYLPLFVDRYEKAFQELKNLPKFQIFNNTTNSKFGYSMETLVITPLGKNFIDICLS